MSLQTFQIPKFAQAQSGRWLWLLSATTFFVLLHVSSLPAQEKSVATESRPATLLTEEERNNATQIDDISVPTPGEFFAAIDKIGTPQWASMFRAPVPNTFKNRLQIALHIGGLVADGYVAVEAQDSQQVKNIGRDLIAFARALAVSEDLIARGSSIVEFADNFEWSALREELEATQNEVKLALTAQKDDELIILVTLGAWLRAAEIASAVIMQNYNPDAACLLRQPRLAAFLRSKIEALPQAKQEDPLVQKVGAALTELETTLRFAPDHLPTLEEVTKIHTLASGIVREITGLAQTGAE